MDSKDRQNLSTKTSKTREFTNSAIYKSAPVILSILSLACLTLGAMFRSRTGWPFHHFPFTFWIPLLHVLPFFLSALGTYVYHCEYKRKENKRSYKRKMLVPMCVNYSILAFYAMIPTLVFLLLIPYIFFLG